ncbi:MAG: hypothetical protein ACI9MC_002670 [Kiritimatiellia bacterium]|jgi:hypothetical protein
MATRPWCSSDSTSSTLLASSAFVSASFSSSTTRATWSFMASPIGSVRSRACHHVLATERGVHDRGAQGGSIPVALDTPADHLPDRWIPMHRSLPRVCQARGRRRSRPPSSPRRRPEVRRRAGVQALISQIAINKAERTAIRIARLYPGVRQRRCSDHAAYSRVTESQIFWVRTNSKDTPTASSRRPRSANLPVNVHTICATVFVASRSTLANRR